MTTVIIELEKLRCGECGLVYAVDTIHVNRLRNSHATFYCPNGHGQWFPAKNEAEKLRDELTRVNARLDQANAEIRYKREALEREQRRHAAAKGQLTKIKKRVGGGICPCCNRYFAGLHAHMTNKHPDWAATENEEK